MLDLHTMCYKVLDAVIADLVRLARCLKGEAFVAFGETSFDHTSHGRALTVSGRRVAERMRCMYGLDVLDVAERNTSLVCSRCRALRRLEPVEGGANPHFVHRCANLEGQMEVCRCDVNAVRAIAFLARELLTGQGSREPFSSPLPRSP